MANLAGESKDKLSNSISTAALCFRTPTAACPAAADELAHRRNGDRSEGRARDAVDFIKNSAQGLALRRCIGSPSVPLNGVQVFEQLDHVKQRCTPSIAGELITATRATNRTDQAGAAHDMHDFRQVVAGDAILLANFGDGKPTAFARGQFQNREDGKPGRNLKSHDIAIGILLPLRSDYRAAGSIEVLLELDVGPSHHSFATKKQQRKLAVHRDHCSHLADARFLELTGNRIEQRATNTLQPRLRFNRQRKYPAAGC